MCSGRYLASTSHDLTLRLWDLDQSKQQLLLQEGHAREVYGLAWHPDGSLLATGDLGGVTRFIFSTRNECGFGIFSTRFECGFSQGFGMFVPADVSYPCRYTLMEYSLWTSAPVGVYSSVGAWTGENYTRNGWRRCENYTRNEWRKCENYTRNECNIPGPSRSVTCVTWLS